MLVKDLIKALSNMPQDLEVAVVWNDRYQLSYDWTVSNVAAPLLANSNGESYLYPEKTTVQKTDVVILKYR